MGVAALDEGAGTGAGGRTTAMVDEELLGDGDSRAGTALGGSKTAMVALGAEADDTFLPGTA